MTKEQFAALLNGREYGNELTVPDIFTTKRNGLVLVYGQSDDLMNFRGAFIDEYNCFRGDVAYINENGFWNCECENEPNCLYVVKEKAKRRQIKAVWHEEGNPYWTYETDIPHATFNIYEHEELYCVGIVFDIDSLKQLTEVTTMHETTNPANKLDLDAPDAPATKINMNVLVAMASPIAVYLRKTLDQHCSVVITDKQVRVVRDECGVPFPADQVRSEGS